MCNRQMITISLSLDAFDQEQKETNWYIPSNTASPRSFCGNLTLVLCVGNLESKLAWYWKKRRKK